MEELMMGVCAPDRDADAELMKEAGIEWVRLGAPFPFEDCIGGKLTDRYRRYRDRAARWNENGIGIMGVTPGPGVKRWEPDEEGSLRMVWHRRLPEWFGRLGGRECLELYEQLCAWLGQDLQGLVQAWQIGNELDWHQFSGPMSPRESCAFILAGARGLTRADPGLVIGHNPTTEPNCYFFYGRLYGRPDEPLDYCGIDRYYGSWHAGEPGDWKPLIEELHELTLAPVLINEWGFASAGGVMTDEDRRRGEITCSCHRWPNTWGPGHTPEGQAEFIRRAFDAFIEVKDKMLGQFFFRWSDPQTCWQCGEPDCPAETAWGVIDVDGNPKPGYEALKDGIRRLREA